MLLSGPEIRGVVYDAGIFVLSWSIVTENEANFLLLLNRFAMTIFTE